MYMAAEHAQYCGLWPDSYIAPYLLTLVTAMPHPMFSPILRVLSQEVQILGPLTQRDLKLYFFEFLAQCSN